MHKDWKTLDRNELMALMKTQSAKQIADGFGVTFATVYNRARLEGVTLRGHVGPRKPTGPSRRFHPPMEELKALMWKLGSMKEVAEHYGVGETVVHKRVHEYGIEVPTKASRMREVALNRTPEHNRKIGEALSKRTGPLAANWKGGVTPDNARARNTTAFREWKTAVFKRDGFRCVECGVEQGHVCGCCRQRVTLEAHHVLPFAGHPERRYDVSNGATLCAACHDRAHSCKQGELLETPESRAATTKPVTASVRA